MGLSHISIIDEIRTDLLSQSGTGVIAVDSGGNEVTEEIYDDLNADQVERLPLTQPHRPVDFTITNADKEGYARTYIVVPSTIYGLATSRFVEAGVQNNQSMQLPGLIAASLDRGQAGTIGKGKNLWPNVEVHERKCSHFSNSCLSLIWQLQLLDYM